MAKTKNRKQNWWVWFAIGLIAALLVSPNTTVIRVLGADIPPLEFTFLRSALIVIVALPFILFSLHKFNKRNLIFTLGAGLCMTIAAISLVYAVQYSNASYAVIMGLIAPILLVLISSRFLGDKISARAAAGVALAAAGALVVVVAPLALSGNTTPHFYPLATALMLANSIFFVLGIIFSRKSNEAGMPLTVNGGLMSVVILVISGVAMYAVEGIPTDIVQYTAPTWLGIFYSGVMVVFIARMMNIASYERIGSAATSGLSYLGTIVGILIPVVFLGEKPSSLIILGGLLILIGVYLTEKHRAKHKHHKYLQPH